MNDLARVAHKWHPLGLQLGVEGHDLDKIRGDGNEAQNCLSKMLSNWLSNNDDAKREDLVDMLRSNAICEQQLARRLMNSKGMSTNRNTNIAHMHTNTTCKKRVILAACCHQDKNPARGRGLEREEMGIQSCKTNKQANKQTNKE